MKYIDKRIHLRPQLSVIRIIITENIKLISLVDSELGEILNEEDLNGNGLTVNIFTEDDEYIETCILLHDKSSISDISHESFHATCRIQDRIGSSLHDSSEENYAYLIGYLSGEINKLFKKYKKLPK